VEPGNEAETTIRKLTVSLSSLLLSVLLLEVTAAELVVAFRALVPLNPFVPLLGVTFTLGYRSGRT